MKSSTPIFSSDFGSLALLRMGHIFRIGTFEDGKYVFVGNGHLKPCSALIWEFYPDGEKDYIYFDDDGKLLFATISETRPDYILKTYSELVKKGADLRCWFNVVRSTFIITELGL